MVPPPAELDALIAEMSPAAPAGHGTLVCTAAKLADPRPSAVTPAAMPARHISPRRRRARRPPSGIRIISPLPSDVDLAAKGLPRKALSPARGDSRRIAV